jgi:GT2 family glycosyltransferase
MNSAGQHLRVVMVNYNGGPLLSRAVESVLDSDWFGSLQVVVVDNDSDDGSIDPLIGLDRVTILQRDTNEGFGANNHGFPELLGEAPLPDLPEPDLVALLNPDAMVRPQTLHRLAAELDPPRKVGAAAPRILFDRPFVELAVTDGDITLTRVMVDDLDVTSQCHGVDGAYRLPGRHTPIWRCAAGTALRIPAQIEGQDIVVETGGASAGSLGPERVSGAQTINLDARHRRVVTVVQNAGSRIDGHGVGHNRGFADPEGERSYATVAPAWCGAAVLFSADYLRDVGGFEPAYFLYYEDIDLSLRGLARGWSTVYVPDAIVEHRHSDSATQGTRQLEVLQHRNRLLMLVRNGSLPHAARAYARAAATPSSLLVSSFRSGDGAARRRLAAWRFRSFMGAVAGIPDALSGRRANNAKRRVPVREVIEAASGS